MAEDNVAIQVETDDEQGNDEIYRSTVSGPEDERSAVSSHRNSLQKLIPLETESVYSSVHSSLKSTTKLMWITIFFSALGGYIFMYLEAPPDLADKRRLIERHLMAREVVMFSIEMIQNGSSMQKRNELKSVIMHFEEQIGCRLPLEKTEWTFWAATLYAGTISTTIGYGNINCKTFAGRTISMIYAIFGIPLMIVILDRLGALLLSILRNCSYVFDDFIFFIAIRWNLLKIREPKQRIRYKAISVKLARWGLCHYNVPTRPRRVSIVDRASRRRMSRRSAMDETEMRPIRRSASYSSNDADSESPNRRRTRFREEQTEITVEETEEEEAEESEEEREPPVVAALLTTISCISLSAAVFCLWEEWDYFTAFYFFFISLSTIGFGDIVPAYPEYMVAMFSLVLIGLSLVTVCINVMQEKISLMYMQLLTRMLQVGSLFEKIFAQKYMEAQEEGDPAALKGFVEGFNSQAKFLMPLMSKNESAKVMKKFKAEAKARGIELPSALTDIDPQTGKPAFISAHNERIDDFIEQKQRETQSVLYSPIFQQNTCSTQTPNLLKQRRMQTEIPDWCLDEYSFGIQFCADQSDGGTQTDTESVDSGVQWESDSEETATQFDPSLISKTVGTSSDIQTATVGIQPEVSFVMELLDDRREFSNSSEESDGQYYGEQSDEEDRRPKVRQTHHRRRQSTDKLKRHSEQRYMKHSNTQTDRNQQSVEIQKGPSTFTEFKDTETVSAIRLEEKETQSDEGKRANAQSQTKIKKQKDIEIQNTIVKVDHSETQSDYLGVDITTDTELTMSDQSIQFCPDFSVKSEQTEISYFTAEVGIQQSQRTMSRRVQTLLSTTMRDREAYERKKEENLKTSKDLFEWEREQRIQKAQQRQREIQLSEDELEILRSRLFKMRLDRAREQRNENEVIRFDVNEEVEKLLDVLKMLRQTDNPMDREELIEFLKSAELPIERIEQTFDFDAVIQLLQKESDQMADSRAEELFTFCPVETQTDISAFQRNDAEITVMPLISELETQTEISAFGMIDEIVEAFPSVENVEISAVVDTIEQSIITDKTAVDESSQTESSFFRTESKEVSALPPMEPHSMQTYSQISDIGVNPIAEVIAANLPETEIADSQTMETPTAKSFAQTEEIRTQNSETQISVETATATVDAIPTVKEIESQYDILGIEFSAQTKTLSSDVGVGEHLETAEFTVQMNVEATDQNVEASPSVAEMGTLPMVSAFRADGENMDLDIHFPVDAAAQSESHLRDAATDPEVSILSRKARDLESAVEADLFDFGVQHDPSMEWPRREVGIQPEVSVIKRRELHDDEDGDILCLADAEVQNSAETESIGCGETFEIVDFESQSGSSAFAFVDIAAQIEASTSNQLCQAVASTAAAESQTQIPSAEVSVQMGSETASAETQTPTAVVADSDSQTKIAVKHSVSQTISQHSEIGVSTEIETAESAVQPEISMFRLEDIQNAEVPTDLMFMRDSAAEPDYELGCETVGVQMEVECSNNEAQTFYSGDIPDYRSLFVELERPTVNVEAEAEIESPAICRISAIVESPQRRQRREAKRRRHKSTQSALIGAEVGIQNAVDVTESQNQTRRIIQRPAETQTHLVLSNSDTQTELFAHRDAEIQNVADSEEKTAQTMIKGPIQRVLEGPEAVPTADIHSQTVLRVTGENVTLFVELKADERSADVLTHLPDPPIEQSQMFIGSNGRSIIEHSVSAAIRRPQRNLRIQRTIPIVSEETATATVSQSPRRRRLRPALSQTDSRDLSDRFTQTESKTATVSLSAELIFLDDEEETETTIPTKPKETTTLRIRPGQRPANNGEAATQTDEEPQKPRKLIRKTAGKRTVLIEAAAQTPICSVVSVQIQTDVN